MIIAFGKFYTASYFKAATVFSSGVFCYMLGGSLYSISLIVTNITNINIKITKVQDPTICQKGRKYWQAENLLFPPLLFNPMSNFVAFDTLDI